jgi:hypothetical protein
VREGTGPTGAARLWGRDLRVGVERFVRRLWQIALDAAKFGSDRVGGKAGAEQAAVERGDLVLAEGASNVREAALQSRADHCSFVGFSKSCFESRVDVGIRHAPAPKLASDTEAPLPAPLSMLPGIIESIAGVIEIAAFAEPRDDGRDSFVIVSPAREIASHFINRMGAPHQRTKRSRVKLWLGMDFSRGILHERKHSRKKTGAQT